VNQYLKQDKSDPTIYYLHVHIVPRSSKNEIVGAYNGSVKIKIKSPPVDNKANAELVEFVSKTLQIKKNQIELILGEKSKEKVLRIKL